MIPLKTTFRAGGSQSSDPFDFKQIDRLGDVALFQKTKTLQRTGKSPVEVVTFEVVIVQRMNEHKWPNGDVTPAHEHMPGDEQWGVVGWSLQTRDRAFEKFREVIQAEKERLGESGAKVVRVTLAGTWGNFLRSPH